MEELEKQVDANMENTEVKDLLSSNIHLVIKLQAWARGNKARKAVKFMRSKQIGSNKYFTMLEFKETVSPRRSKDMGSFGKTFGSTDDFLK